MSDFRLRFIKGYIYRLHNISSRKERGHVESMCERLIIKKRSDTQQIISKFMLNQGIV